MGSDEKLDFNQVTAKGTFWVYAARYSGKLVVFLSTIILARLLTKDDFGIVGYALVVTNFLDIVRDLGIGSAVIYQKDDPNASDTAFWLVLVVGVSLFGITWVAAPLVGEFFRDDRAIMVTRMLALSFPISAFGKIHDVLLRKELAFDRAFIPSFARNMGKAVLSVGFAFLGFGVWSLVIGNVGAVLVFVIVLWIVLPWRPSFQFDWKIAKEQLSYGVGILSVNIFAYFLRDSDSLFVGRFLGTAALGVYSLAFRIPDLVINEFSNVISTVTFPVYARMQDNRDELRQSFFKAAQTISFITIPAGLGLALVSRPFVLTFFTEKWVEAIPVLQAISIYAMLFSLSYNAGSVYKATGRPYILTKLAIVRFAMLIPAFYFAVTQFGTIASVGWAHALVALVAGSLNLVVAGRIMEASFSDLFNVFRPALVGGIFMSLIVILVLRLSIDFAALAQLSLAVVGGGIVYLSLLAMQKPALVRQARKTLNSVLSRRIG